MVLAVQKVVMAPKAMETAREVLLRRRQNLSHLPFLIWVLLEFLVESTILRSL